MAWPNRPDDCPLDRAGAIESEAADRAAAQERGTRMRPDLRVGFIGLGNLGEPMATQVARSGFDLTVCDVRPEPVERLVRLGARSAGTVGELAKGCNVILVAVVDDRQVVDVLLGDDGSQGLLDLAPPGSIVVLHSTIHPLTCCRLHDAGLSRRIDVLDAPVTGGPAAAETGSLSVMVGGSAAALERCLPVLLAMGDEVTRLGEAGAGQVAKIANNVALAITLRAVHEALSFAEASGVPPGEMLALLGKGAASSWVVDNWSLIGENVRNYQAGGASGVADLTYKDLSLALSIAHGNRLALTATALTAQLLVDPYRAAEEFARSSHQPAENEDVGDFAASAGNA
jgi:3-hydroxyisobutyrate dehydrogenase-like beta-hydroxyacid dehydrogenase